MRVDADAGVATCNLLARNGTHADISGGCFVSSIHDNGLDQDIADLSAFSNLVGARLLRDESGDDSHLRPPAKAPASRPG